MSGGGKLSAVSQLINLVQGDLRTLSSEARRKHPAVKESVERAILKLRHYSTLQNDAIIEALQNTDDVVHPLLFACETKNARFIQLSLTSLQRLISQNAIPESHVSNIIGLLCSVMSLGLDDLRVLQTIVLLFTSTQHVHGAQLAKVLAICFRLHTSKDPVTSNTAIAAMRQLVTSLFERMAAEEEAAANGNLKTPQLQSSSRKSPVNLPPCAQDAYLVFQDLCQLTNGDPPYWLTEVPEISRTLGLELLESLLSAHPEAFLQIPEFSFMLKERVCPLVIKLFSPSIKYNLAMSPNALSSGGAVADKPSFPVCLRLLRIVGVLIKHFYVLLVTECEIFLSLLVKFLEIDKPIWQRVLAVEVLHQLAVQPRLLRSFCYFYDLQEQSTKVFADIICSLHFFIQNQLQPKPSASLSAVGSGHQVNSDGSTVPDSSGMSISSSPSNLYREGFLYGGTTHSVLALSPVGTARGMLLQMLEKHEAPQVAEGYALSEGVSCLLDTVHSVGLSPIVDSTLDALPSAIGSRGSTSSNILLSPVRSDHPTLAVDGGSGSSSTVDITDTSSDCGVTVIGSEADSDRVVSAMVKVSSKDILGSLSLLLDASQVPSVTEAVLRAFHTLVGVCGRVELDALMLNFLQNLCRAAQPVSDLGPLGSPTTNPEDRMATIRITPKKMQCTKCLLSIALVHGAVLRDTWLVALDCYQTMFAALNLQVMQSQTQEELMNQGEGSHLALLLQQLCQNSAYLSDKGLLDLLNALCALFSAARNHANSGREPSLFSCHLLVLCCKVNLKRLPLFWKLLVKHILSACASNHAGLRDASAKCLTAIVPLALREHGESGNRETFHDILLSLSRLSECSKADVCNHQLTCVFEILQSLGDQLSDDWPLILQIIRSSAQLDNSGVVQLGFEALQLVVADFLALLPLTCLTQCLDVASHFGLQTQDLNISLTAVGLLWNISDFLCHHQSTIEVGLPQDFTCPWLSSTTDSIVSWPKVPARRREAAASVGETTSSCSIVTAEPREDQPAAAAALPTTVSGVIRTVEDMASEIPRYDCLWCSLFYVLGRLCIDERAAVRKSAAQTLFSTIDAHGHLLSPISWNIVLWKVLFPLLEYIQHTLDTVEQSGEKAKQSSVVIVHHSRNTLRKQWAETQVLTLQGIAGIFAQQLEILALLIGFHRAWDMLLSAIHACVSEGQGELAMAALRSLHQLLLTKRSDQAEQQDLWQQLWQVWRQLALQCAQLPTTPSMSYRQASAASQSSNQEQPVDRSSLQTLLCVHMQQLPYLQDHLSAGFSAAHLRQLRKVMSGVLSVPADQVTLMTSNSSMTPLQESSLSNVQKICSEAAQTCSRDGETSTTSSESADSKEGFVFALFELVLQLTSFATSLPSNLQPASKEQRKSCILLGEAAWRIACKLYTDTHNGHDPTVLLCILKALQIPLACKYSCPSTSTWLLALEVLLTVVPIGLAALRNAEAVPSDVEVYTVVLQICEDFLFPASDPPGVLSVDDRLMFEEKDVCVVHLIRDEILSHTDQCPPRVVSSAIELLNRGSILSQTSPLDVTVAEFNLLGREQVARACFETLLNCSVLVQGKGRSASVALESLVRRCCSVLKKFQQDEKLTGDCPLPRSQLAETSFVLHAVALMLQTMKTTPTSEQTTSMWQQLIQLYPVLVSCVTCNSTDVRSGVQKVLGEYAVLITIPGEAGQPTPSPSHHVAA
eukprot:scpid7760/ scgid7743/ Protein MON2 homolog; Protein SF21